MCTRNFPDDATDISSNNPWNAEVQNQTGSLTFDQDYNIVWGNSQAVVKQTDGNAFVIDIEKDGDFDPLDKSEDGVFVINQVKCDVDVQAENLGGFDDVHVMLNETEPSLNPDSVVSSVNNGTLEASLKADSAVPDIDKRSYTCGLNILADLCERETVSRLRKQQGSPNKSFETKEQGSPNKSFETKDILIAGQGTLSPAVNNYISMDSSEVGIERELMSETDSLCRIASSFSLASFNERSAV